LHAAQCFYRGQGVGLGDDEVGHRAG